MRLQKGRLILFEAACRCHAHGVQRLLQEQLVCAYYDYADALDLTGRLRMWLGEPGIALNTSALGIG
jgi:hypothetical protein